MNGVIDTATGDLLRAGYCEFEAGEGEKVVADVPELATVRGAVGTQIMYRLDGGKWVEVAQPAIEPTPVKEILMLDWETGMPVIVRVRGGVLKIE